MNHLLARSLALLLAIGLVACGSIPRNEGQLSTGIDGVACVGMVSDLPSGVFESRNDALLDEARGASGEGRVCAGKTLIARQSLRVYRLFDSRQYSSRYGRWWVLTRPIGPREAYRQSYAICSAWSGLDRLVSCSIKPGAEIVIGTTQSADCEEGTYPKSQNLQVYVPNDASGGKVPLEDCSDEGVWP
ncbi:MAG TPA: hypothetical protein VLG48_12090 [Candidatus Methylomirabilis sp.]|nr:hypothetical protein [Candidatus Methylomirabilis sp.]